MLNIFLCRLLGIQILLWSTYLNLLPAFLFFKKSDYLLVDEFNFLYILDRKPLSGTCLQIKVVWKLSILLMVLLDTHMCFYEVCQFFIFSFLAADSEELVLFAPSPQNFLPQSFLSSLRVLKSFACGFLQRLFRFSPHCRVFDLPPVEFCVCCEVAVGRVKIYFLYGHPFALHIYWKDLSFSIELQWGLCWKQIIVYLSLNLNSILFHWSIY